MNLLDGHPSRSNVWATGGLALTLAMLLASCGGGGGADPSPAPAPDPAPVVVTPTPAPTTSNPGLGVIEIDITGVGTKSPTSQMRWDDGVARRRALNASAAAVTNLSSGLDIQFQSASSIDVGSRPGGTRYISVTYKVRNGQFCSAPGTCTAYTVPRSNVTFLAVIASTSINSSAITRFTRFDGSPAATALATQLIPTHGMNATATAVDATRASMQVYRENELPAADPSVTDVLPYGFVVNNVNNGSRTLPASPAVNQFDGQVTFAFKIPLQATAQDDPFKISMRFQVLEDSNTRVTQSLEDTDASVGERAAALGSSDTAVLCNRLASVLAGNPICSVRLAGSAASPLGYINTPPVGPPVVQASPSNLNNVSTTAELVVGTSQAMNPPSATSLVVHGSMSGMRTLTGAYSGTWASGGSGANSNQLAFKLGPTDKPFFRGEKVSFTATSGNTGASGALSKFSGAFLTQGAAQGSSGRFEGERYTVGAQSRGMASGDLNGDGRVDVVVANYGADTVSVLMAKAGGGFEPAVNYQVGTNPYFVTIGDVNGDGRLDIVVAVTNIHKVGVLRANAGGTFDAVEHYSVGTFPNAVSLADVNNDGLMDIVSADFGSSTVTILYANGSGGYYTGLTITGAAGVANILAKDMNNDGVIDLVSANFNGGTVSIFLATAPGVFSPRINIALGGAPQGLAIDDLNNDGLQDIVVADYNSSLLRVIYSTAPGVFGPLNTYAAGPNPLGIVVRDINGDGLKDLIIANANSGSPTISVFHQALGNTFSARIIYPVAGRPWDLVLLNATADNIPDILFSTDTDDLGFLFGLGGTFGSSRSYATNASGAEFVALADLNGDSHLDAVISNVFSHNVSVFIGVATGGFLPPVNYPTGGSFLGDLSLGDVNGDGKIDIVVANQVGQGVSVLLGSGDGTIGATQSFNSGGANPVGLALGDVNGDGKLDIVVPNRDSNNVGILLANGSGSFPASPANTYAAGSSPVAVVLGDVNRDGKLDIVIVNNTASLNLLLGNGDGTFQSAVSIPLSGTARRAAIADVNNDGKPDIVAALAGSNTVAVLFGDGLGGFVSGGNYSSPSPSAVAIGDINGDGFLDIVASSFGPKQVNVFLGNSSGTFSSSVVLKVPGATASNSLAIGDLNGDGRLDVVTANGAAQTISIAKGF